MGSWSWIRWRHSYQKSDWKSTERLLGFNSRIRVPGKIEIGALQTHIYCHALASDKHKGNYCIKSQVKHEAFQGSWHDEPRRITYATVGEGYATRCWITSRDQFRQISRGAWGKILRVCRGNSYSFKNKIRHTLNEIYFGKSRDIVHGLRSIQPLQDEKAKKALADELNRKLNKQLTS